MLPRAKQEFIRRCSELLGTCVERTLELNPHYLTYNIRWNASMYDSEWYYSLYHSASDRSWHFEWELINVLFDPENPAPTKAELVKKIVAETSAQIFEFEETCAEDYSAELKVYAELESAASAILTLDKIAYNRKEQIRSLYGFRTVTLHSPVKLPMCEGVSPLSLVAINAEGLDSVWKRVLNNDIIGMHRKNRDEPQMSSMDIRKERWYASISAGGTARLRRFSLHSTEARAILSFLNTQSRGRMQNCVKSLPLTSAILQTVFADVGAMILRHYASRVLHTVNS